jgi:hypothetical protein
LHSMTSVSPKKRLKQNTTSGDGNQKNSANDQTRDSDAFVRILPPK